MALLVLLAIDSVFLFVAIGKDPLLRKSFFREKKGSEKEESYLEQDVEPAARGLALIRLVSADIWQPIIVVGVLGFSSGILRAFNAAGGVDAFTLSLVRLICSAMIFLLSIVFIRKHLSFKSNLLSLILLVLASSAFLLLPVVGISYRIISALIIDVVYLFAGMLLAILSLIVGCRTRAPILSMGLGQGIPTFFTTVGFLVFVMIGRHISNENEIPWIVAVVTLYAIIMVIIVMNIPQVRGKRKDQKEQRPASRIFDFGDKEVSRMPIVVSMSENDIRSNKQLTEVYLLSDREMDVLILAFTGRNASSIADALFLSKETVRTHLKSIHKKLGVHSKEELRDFVEQLLTSGSSVNSKR